MVKWNIIFIARYYRWSNFSIVLIREREQIQSYWECTENSKMQT